MGIAATLSLRIIGKLQHSIRLAEDENGALLNASAHFVNLHRDAFQEPDLPWSESEAKCLLLKASLDRKIPWEPDASMPTKDINMSTTTTNARISIV
jgi:hypothetical protein